MTEDTNENIIDAEYNDVENIIYLTAKQVAIKIGTTEATVRTWADEEYYGDLIKIEKINGRKTYKETQVHCFAFIKDLVENKNMKKSQVRKYIEKHGFEYAEYNSGLVDPKDPLGFQALASALSVEVGEQLNKFQENILNQVDDRLKSYIILQGEAITNVLDNTILKVDEVVSEKLDESSKDLKQHIDISTEKSTQIQQENKQKLEELALDMAEMKETNNKLKELLDDPEAKEKLVKSIKKEKDSWLSKLAKKIKNK